MKYDRFEQLPVWQTEIKLATQIYSLTKQPPFRRQRSLRDQIERAAVSVSNNIAEGFERGTTQELLTFLYIARGSAGEVRSMLCLIEGIAEFANLKSEISNLKLQAEGISRSFGAGPTRCKIQPSRASATSTARRAKGKLRFANARNSCENWSRSVKAPRTNNAKPAIQIDALKPNVCWSPASVAA
jgi:four helix bundle protein